MDGAVLRQWRRARGWDVPETARRLRKAATDGHVPTHDSLVTMVHRWERADLSTERYELLYARALGISPEDLSAGPHKPETTALPPPPRGDEDDRRVGGKRPGAVHPVGVDVPVSSDLAPEGTDDARVPGAAAGHGNLAADTTDGLTYASVMVVLD